MLLEYCKRINCFSLCCQRDYSSLDSQVVYHTFSTFL